MDDAEIVLSPILARTDQQRKEALAKANVIRKRRARLKRELKESSKAEAIRRVKVMVFDPPNYVETMKAYDLVKAVPKLGKMRCDKVFAKCLISHLKTLAGLTDRQRRALIEVLG